eukprot:16444099-Heterocapsa_arctica.AAC.1
MPTSSAHARQIPAAMSSKRPDNILRKGSNETTKQRDASGQPWITPLLMWKRNVMTEATRAKAETSVWIALTMWMNPCDVLRALKTIIIHC